MLCTIYIVDIETFDGDMPPPTLDEGDEDMSEAQAGEAHPQGAMRIHSHKASLWFQMDNYDILARVLVEEGFFLARDKDINTNPRFVDRYKDSIHKMMSLVSCH